MVINTMGWIEGLGYELLLHSIQALKVGMLPHETIARELGQMRVRLSGSNRTETVAVFT